MGLLERENLLATLATLLESAATDAGVFTVVEGEAGIGKTAVLQAFAAGRPRGLPVFWGGCDALQTPRPLGPLYDMAAQAGGRLLATLESDAVRPQVFSAFLEMLSAQPLLVLIEDLHWADEATLDLLRYVGRRVASTRSMVVASLRSDELGPGHPLRLVLGDLATYGVRRLSPRPLTRQAVAELAGDREIDVAELHRKTGGNPFYVTEVLAAGGEGVPATVRDAVLARANRLTPSARALLDAAAVAGPRVEPWLLQEIVNAESGSVDECLACGILRVEEGAFRFRHELGRQAILGGVAPTGQLSLHRLVLRALRSPGVPEVDAARLAHHAEGAADVAAVQQFAIAAAREAAAKGAHPQAAQQFMRALRHAGPTASARAPLLDDYALECHLAGRMQEAIHARQVAARNWSELGEVEREVMSLSRLASALVASGRNAESETVMQVALARAGPSSHSAAALAARRWHAYLRMLDRDTDEAIREGSAALEIAERIGDQESITHCLNTIGSAMIVSGRVAQGRELLERGLAIAEKMQSDLAIANALLNLGSGCGEVYAFDLAEDYLRRGIEFSLERDMDFARLYGLSWHALVMLYRGRWSDAAAAAHAVRAAVRSPAIARMMALIALGRMRARRGDPGVWEALDAARDLAGDTGTLQRVAPMHAARAEAAWLEGRNGDAAREAAGGVQLAVRKRHAWFAAELLFWRAAGEDADVPPEFCSGNPFALEAAGHWREAADGWRTLGCPFEMARALAAGDEAAQREALATFESLDARPMIERVRRLLRSAGVRGLPRGPRDTTRKHPAGLTSKEVAVLGLLGEGLRNKDIAQRLNRSPRTIEHHLAAIFAKLEVANRAEAVSAAYRLGLISAPDLHLDAGNRA